jgi:hypothetical protein
MVLDVNCYSIFDVKDDIAKIKRFVHGREAVGRAQLPLQMTSL